MTFLKTYGHLLIIAAALILILVWSHWESSPPLSPAKQKTTEAAIASDQKQVGADTTKAKATAASAATTYEAGTAYAGLGKVLHQQSKPHAKPNLSDTAAERLQRYLSGY
jgi:predicted lipid-binding transport protein (Tim44 family)